MLSAAQLAIVTTVVFIGHCHNLNKIKMPPDASFHSVAHILYFTRKFPFRYNIASARES